MSFRYHNNTRSKCANKTKKKYDFPTFPGKFRQNKFKMQDKTAFTRKHSMLRANNFHQALISC